MSRGGNRSRDVARRFRGMYNDNDRNDQTSSACLYLNVGIWKANLLDCRNISVRLRPVRLPDYACIAPILLNQDLTSGKSNILNARNASSITLKKVVLDIKRDLRKINVLNAENHRRMVIVLNVE